MKHYFANPQIHKLQSKLQMWLEAYRNPCLHFILSFSSCCTLHRHAHTHTHYRIPRLRMRTEAKSMLYSSTRRFWSFISQKSHNARGSRIDRFHPLILVIDSEDRLGNHFHDSNDWTFEWNRQSPSNYNTMACHNYIQKSTNAIEHFLFWECTGYSRKFKTL